MQYDEWCQVKATYAYWRLIDEYPDDALAHELSRQYGSKNARTVLSSILFGDRTMLLQSAERARDFAKLDPTTGMMEFFSEDGGSREILQSTISGSFSLVEGSLVAFYRDNGVLKLKLDDIEHLIDETTSSEIEESQNRFAEFIRGQFRRIAHGPSDAHRRFLLRRNGEIVLTFDYRPPAPSNIPFDPTPFVEAEDFDFVLFIHNVLSDPARRKSIWN